MYLFLFAINMKTIFIFYTFIITCLISCSHPKKAHDNFSLRATNESIRFILDNNTRSSIETLQIYKDKNGLEYLTFQNPDINDILFYDLSTCELKFRIQPEIDGPNGVAFVLGYYIHNLDSIFLTTRGFEDISLIDSCATVIDKFNYENSVDGISLKGFHSVTSVYTPIIILGKKLYIVPGCNRWQPKSPMSAYIDLETKNVYTLPLNYPKFPNATNKNKRAGIEEYLSQCFDGKRFIYSFYFDEDIYVTSMNQKNIERYNVKSKYINKVEYIDDFGRMTMEQICELANYGNLIYDKYRNVYYRIAYPKTKLEKNINGIELRTYGRKNFSIIILDDKFNIIGETLFPDYTYNSTLMFIREDGLYISDSHYLNPNYSDDILSFRRFELVKLNK